MNTVTQDEGLLVDRMSKRTGMNDSDRQPVGGTGKFTKL